MISPHNTNIKKNNYRSILDNGPERKPMQKKINMNLPISYSKYNNFLFCPLKYTHQYILKTESEFKIQYPLVLGQLTHLFVELFNDEKFDKGDILNLKNNLDQLYELIDLKYPSYYNNQYEIKQIDISESTGNLINFIEETPAVFFHAVKLFNVYNSSFFPKINGSSSNILSEMTFHNIKKINDEFTVCLYGSIDIVFYNLIDEILKFIYISDIKTGKRLYDHYIDQLYFYFYNIIEYNTEANKNIINTTDNIEIISTLKNKMNMENSMLILFSLQENKPDKKNLVDVKDEYDKFIEKMFDVLENDIYHLHKEKDFIVLEELFGKYKKEYKLKEVEKCNRNEVSYLCNYCDYINDCEYRKLN